MFGWSINSPILSGQAISWQGITTWLVGETGHGFSYIFWYVELKIAWIDAIWTYNVLSWIPTTLWLYITPRLPWILVLLTSYLVKYVYYLKRRAILLTFQYGVDPLKNMNNCRLVENCIYKQFYAFLRCVLWIQYFKIIFWNNCEWKMPFHKFSHIWTGLLSLMAPCEIHKN